MRSAGQSRRNRAMAGQGVRSADQKVLSELAPTSLAGRAWAAVRARAGGVAAMLRKPYTAEEVLDAIARVLGEARKAGA